jgi:hypothetical protein
MVTRPGDTLVLFLLIGVIFYLIWKKLLDLYPTTKEPDEEIEGEVPDLLRQHGYEVVGEKERILFDIGYGGRQYASRLFIDYFARREDAWYIVIVARSRKPVRESGAGLRDFFLPFYLLYRPDAILYVDREQGTIKEIEFDIPDVSFQKNKHVLFYLAPVLLILFAAVFILL